jgi:hypothetical protein
MTRRRERVAFVVFFFAAVGSTVAVTGSDTTTTRTTTQVVARPPRLATPTTGEKDIPVTGGKKGQAKAAGAGYRPASGCGIERWAVKTLTDPGANAVNLTPVDSTVAQLVAFPAPVNPTDRVAPIETTTYRIKVSMDSFKMEADSDIHLAVHDQAGHTMIVEFPSPSCDQGSVAATQIAAARDAFLKVAGQPSSSYQPVTGTATIEGIGFFDRIHGQRGVAPNGIELHPATKFTTP